jgi:hypothetical protein
MNKPLKLGLIIIIYCYTISYLIAQNYRTGLNFDDEAYALTPVNKAELKRSYDNLPTKVDLKPYCPLPQKQDDKSTCVGWAVGYAACTISEAISKNMTDKAQLSEMATSPEFIYAYGKANTDTECAKGIGIDKTLQKLYGIAIPRKKEFNMVCASNIPPATTGKGIKIRQHTRLFAKEDSWELRLKQLKKALSNQKPIVIGIDCYKSFFDTKTVWDGQATDFRGGHALSIIGYDDTYEGGSVEVINSWGLEWGNQGFAWIRYPDLQQILKYAYEITTDFSNNSIAVQQSLVSKSPELGVQIDLKLQNGNEMPVIALSKPTATRGLKPVKDTANLSKNISHYKTIQAYTSGTRYRIYHEASQPVHLYVIGSDMTTGEAAVLFPPDVTISPYLSNKNTTIALPDEQWFIEMDNTKGKDYMLFLYSNTPLSISTLVQSLNAQKMAFLEKLQKIPNVKMIDGQRLDTNQIKLSMPLSNDIIQALCIEIEHQ